MPVAAKLSHDQREQLVLTDLSAAFPDFAGEPLSWTKVPDGQDPPDFLGVGQNKRIGLELIEWLDGGQMGPAKTREARRMDALRVLRASWKAEYAPQNFRGAFIDVGEKKIAAADEAGLRKEFFECAAQVDRAWLTNPERTGKALGVNDFSGYPLMRTYFGGIRFIGGAPHGLCWIDVQGDGGAYDPSDTIETLKQALDKKLSDYSTPEKQAHLQAHGLSELDLLVHGGFNAYAYNSPSGPLSLEDIAQRGAAFYASHPQRQIFNRLWFYDSLDSADDLNRLIGYPPGYGRVRWLAQRANRRKQEILLSLLREAREQKGLRQSDVAAALNCPQTRVSKYELGTRRLDLLELRDVCKVLGVSLVDFVRTFDAGVGAVESGELKPKVSAPSRRKPEALR